MYVYKIPRLPSRAVSGSIPTAVHVHSARIAKNSGQRHPEYIHIIYNIQTSYNVGKNLYLNAYCYFKESSILGRHLGIL